MRRSIPQMAILALALQTSSACSEACAPEEPLCQVNSITIEPASVEFVALGDTVRLRVSLKSNNREVAPPSGLVPTWTSSAPLIASVNADGTVTALANGQATITASYADSARVATVRVTQAVAGTVISVQPGGAKSGLLLTPQPTVSLVDALGNVVTSNNSATITASLATGGGTLGGTTTRTVAAGTATFTNLFVTGTDGARTLRFTSGTHPAVTSAAFFVADSAPPPTGAWFVEDFSTYASTSQLLTTGGGRAWQSFYLEDQGSIVLDDTRGVNIDGYNLTKSMRVNFPDASTWTNDTRVVNGQQDRCDNYTLRPVLVPNGTAFNSKRHLWFEFYFRFSPNWTTAHPASWNCNAGAEDHKTWLLLPQGGSGRWQVKIGRGMSALGPVVASGDPINGGDLNTNVKLYQNGDLEVIGSTYWDGDWHQMRAEVSLGDPGVANGIWRVWLDGTLVNQYTNQLFPAAFVGFSHMEMGANRNHGAPGAMQFSWGLIRVWDQNPGWP